MKRNFNLQTTKNKTYKKRIQKQNDHFLLENEDDSDLNQEKHNEPTYSKFGLKSSLRNNTPLVKSNIKREENKTLSVQTDIIKENAYQSSNYKYSKKEPKTSKPRYAQRRESVSSNSSVTNNSTYKEKSRIPVPNIVKRIVKDPETAESETVLKKNNTMKGKQSNKTDDLEIFEYDSFDYRSSRNQRETAQIQNLEPLELYPTFIDNSFDDICINDQTNLVVNLEDLVNEEHLINHISESIK